MEQRRSAVLIPVLERTALDASARYCTENADKRPLGGTDHRSYYSNPGNILNPLTFVPAYGLPSNQDGGSLSASDLLPGSINLFNTYDGIQLLPDRKLHSFYVSGRQQLDERDSSCLPTRGSVTVK